MTQQHPIGKGVFDYTYSSTLEHFRRWMGPAGESKSEDEVLDILISTLEASDFHTLYLKMANGYYPWTPSTPEGRLLPKIISRAKAARIRVAGWHYVYHKVPNQEVTAAKLAMDTYQPDFWVIDAEGEARGNPTGATVYVQGIRRSFPKMPMGLCSYRYPSTHPTLPWQAYLAECQFHAPQVYWVLRAVNDPPARQLANSVAQLQRIRQLPVVPVGAAYRESALNRYWRPTVEEIQNFDQACRAMSLPGNSWWVLRDMFRWPEYWDRIRSFTWDDPVSAPNKTHWSQATESQKDKALLQLAQAGGLVDEAGYLLNRS